MSIIAAVAFRSALSGWSFVSAAAIGAIGASAIVLLAALATPAARRERRPVGARLRRARRRSPSAASPTPGAYADFARGLVDGWADLLSSAPPADITQQLRALPFTVAWLSAAIGGEIARGSRRPGLPAIGPILALALSLLFTIEERWLALAQGAGILAGTLLLIAAGQRLAPRRFATLDEFDAGGRVGTNRARLMLGAVVVVGAVVAAPLVGPHLPGAEANERFDLRRYQVPPFDPLAVPSPLAEVKASLKDDRKADVVFTVTGDTPVTRFPLAVLTDYDGVIWTVADPQRDAAAHRVRARRHRAARPRRSAARRLRRSSRTRSRSRTWAAASCPPPASPGASTCRPPTTARRSTRASTCAPARSPCPAGCPTA